MNAETDLIYISLFDAKIIYKRYIDSRDLYRSEIEALFDQALVPYGVKCLVCEDTTGEETRELLIEDAVKQFAKTYLMTDHLYELVEKGPLPALLFADEIYRKALIAAELAVEVCFKGNQYHIAATPKAASRYCQQFSTDRLDNAIAKRHELKTESSTKG